MPIYDFYCPVCAKEHRDIVRKLKDYGKPCACPICGSRMTQLLSAPMLTMDYAGYQCPITGKWIEGRRQHRENLKRHGCRVFEAGEKEDMLRKKQAEEKALDARLEETVGTMVEGLQPREQEKLFQELQHGADVTVVRR